MRPPRIRKALDEYAERELPPTPDLWPAIRRELAPRPPQAGRVYIEATERRVGRWLPAALLPVVLIALVVGSLLNPSGPRGTPSTPGATISVPPAATGTSAASTATSSAADRDAYLVDLFRGNFATQLGIDAAQINADFTAAANDTIDQAVRDGTLTADEAAQQKARAAQGVDALFLNAAPAK